MGNTHLTQNQLENWYKLDISTSDKSPNNIEGSLDRAMIAVGWLTVNSAGKWGLVIGKLITDPILFRFRFELQEDRDLLSLYWSSL